MELTRKPELRVNVHHLDTPSFANAPVFIVPYGDIRTKEAYPLDAQLCRGNSNFTSSLATAFIYMALAAGTLGLGCQWVSCLTHPYPQCLIRDLLNVPNELEMYDMLALGFPDMKPKPRVVRLKEEMVHYNSLNREKMRSDQQVKDYIANLRRG
jgi:nitroreductase